MADTQGSASEGSASVRFEIVSNTDMPTERNLVPVERCGELTWFVREGHMSPALCTELNRALTHVTRTGRWTQNWDGPGKPPRHS
ncbi:hypothetical protein [Streptomyces sp. PTD5-9]|uniref:hypothetical protein n=1 Tax=Streptomyces sp. PTD5-9 TaxID=3120150 RepID=UPI00300B895E